jgi:hypothetical protein
MSTGQEAPALIQYACERCKTRFVLPPSRRRLGFGGRLRATGMALSRTLRFREGLGSTYDGARRQLLAKMDDDAYQSFVQSFKFCHECRQFVCSECWSTSRKTCLGCFAKAAGTAIRPRPPFAPDGPSVPRPAVGAAALGTAALAASVGRANAATAPAATAPAATAPAVGRRRLRTDASLLVMAAAVILLAFELVIMLPGIGRSNDAGPTATNFVAADSPSASPTDAPTTAPTPTATLVPTASPTPTATPTASPTPSPSPSPSPSPTPKPATPKPATPKPVVTPKPYPTSVTLNCSAVTGAIKCTMTNYDSRATSMAWQLTSPDAAPLTSGVKAQSVTFAVTTPGVYGASLSVVIGGHTITSGPPQAVGFP